MLTTEGVPIGNVTFEPGCRNNWHIHKADKGGGQILLCTNGRGWYQEWGKEEVGGALKLNCRRLYTWDGMAVLRI